jgi:P-aminobenzoate N-oxygenase AurF
VTEPGVAPVRSFEASTRRLIERSASTRANRHAGFAWAAPAPDRFAMSPALTPLAGLSVYRELSDAQRWQLGLLEAVSFFSLNISGERELMKGLEARLAGDVPAHVSRYLPHFLREEADHTDVFKRFCLSYGGFTFRDRQVRFPQEFVAGEENFVFFARALIFEEIADFYNRKLAADDSLWLLARDINRYHAEDEARHIAFGRLYVAAMWEEHSAQWTAEEKARIAGYLKRYLQSVQRSYVNADVYRHLGMPPEVRDEVLRSAHWAAIAEQSACKLKRWLDSIDLHL